MRYSNDGRAENTFMKFVLNNKILNFRGIE